jgi:1,4-alpha-glucan branching enzyme
MSQQAVSADGIHIAGTFNGFSTTANEMTSVGAGIYETTIAIAENSTVRYKFINGNSFSVQENVPQACGVDNGFGGFDRNLTVFAEPLILPLVCFNECSNCVVPNTLNLTFRVNMSQQTVSADGVHLAGSFNAFSSTATPMLSVGGGIYEAQVIIDEGVTAQYVFINGNTFATQETVPAACGVNNGFGGFNRSVVTSSANTILPTVCFSSCTNCIIPTTSNVTFRVNMALQTVSSNGVFLAGSFNNWSPTATPMQSIGGSVYEAVVALDTTSTIQYKFLNGNSFTNQELVPEACGIPNGVQTFDRNLVVPNSNTILPTVCFGACVNCPVSNLISVTFRVNMSLQNVSPDGVHLAGTFNNFSPTATPMTAIGGGVYEATVEIDANATITFKYINGITFATQEGVPQSCGVDNGFSGFDRILTVPNEDTVLPTVCFSSCVNCVIPATTSVTFRVNMSLQTVNATGVHLAGSFNGFSSTANPMTLVGNGIYESTVSIDTTLTVQYVFLNGNSFTNQESVPSSCGVDNGFGGFNRSLVVPNSNTTIPTVCFGECSNCIIPTTSNVTFRVNMSQQTVGTNGVHVSGSFNNWNPSGTPMTLTTNGVYEATVSITAGTIVQYKFINGNTFATQETVPSACGVANDVGGFDREITVGATDETLPVVCFGECSNCIIPGLSSVTFRVNMSLQTVNAAGVFLAGSFNSFSPTANAMTLVGNGIYEATVSIDTTLTIQYVFLNGNTFANQELVPSSCGVDNGFGGFNRSFVVPEVNAILPTVCFGSCSNCVLPILAQVTFYVNMSEETISPSGVFLAGSFNNFNTTANPMTNVGGGIFKTEVSIDTTAIVQYKFINGTTFESVPSVCGVDDGFGGFNRRIVVPEAAIFALPIVCFSSCENCVPNAIENTNSTKLSFAPNPTSSSIAIANGESLKSISVIDNLGKELMFITNNNRSVVSIDLSSLSSGIYFVKCFTDKETFTQKILKQ